MIKHYVEFFYPGIIVDDSSSQEIAEHDPSAVKMPEYAYAFKFYDREETEGEHGTMYGPRFNQSGTYFSSGKIYTVADVEREYPQERILLSNMTGNKIARVIRTDSGVWREFHKEDKICSAPTVTA